MVKSTHLFPTVAALAVAALLLAPGTGAAFPADISPVSGASPGAVKWCFQVSGQYVLNRPAVGPDGGVVVASSTGDVYSLTAEGALRWVVPSVGSYGGPSIGADGTTYVGSGCTITAIAPNGSIRWTYTEPTSDPACRLQASGQTAPSISPVASRTWNR